jgi:hypothetical protein
MTDSKYDLAPCNFYLFPKVKNIMQGEHFVTVGTIKRESTKLLKGTDKGGHAALLSRVGEALDQVHSVRGRVLQG